MRRNLLRQEVFNRIKELILANHFRSGERIFDGDLAALLGVSRTPVREALARLCQDGLLEAKDGKGYFVVNVYDTRQIEDLYDLREALEAHAVRRAVERARPQDLEDLASVIAKLESFRGSTVPEQRVEELQEGLRVHEIIARMSGNALLYDTMLRLLTRMRLFFWIEMISENASEAEETRREHAGLLTHIRSKQPDEAESLIRTHIRRAREQILRVVSLRAASYPPVDLSPIGATSLRAGFGRAGDPPPRVVRHPAGGRGRIPRRRQS